jgi:hypothetical protein
LHARNDGNPGAPVFLQKRDRLEVKRQQVNPSAGVH